jgi:hypothetical protein
VAAVPSGLSLTPLRIPLIRIQNNAGIEMNYENNFQEKEHIFNHFLHNGTLNPYPYH